MITPFRISRPTGHEIPPDCLSLLAASNLAAGMFLGFNQSVGPSVDCPAQAEAEPPPQALCLLHQHQDCFDNFVKFPGELKVIYCITVIET